MDFMKVFVWVCCLSVVAHGLEVQGSGYAPLQPKELDVVTFDTVFNDTNDSLEYRFGWNITGTLVYDSWVPANCTWNNATNVSSCRHFTYKTIPLGAVGMNVSTSVNIRNSTSQASFNSSVLLQDITLTVESFRTANAGEDIYIVGHFIWEDRSPVANQLVTVSIPQLGFNKAAMTDVTGYYVVLYTVPIGVKSGTYMIESQAVHSGLLWETNATIDLFGRTTAVVKGSPSVTVLDDTTYHSQDNVSVSAEFTVTGLNGANGVAVTFGHLAGSTVKNCGTVSGVCNVSAVFALPEGTMPGTYIINVTAAWSNDDSTAGSASDSVELRITENRLLGFGMLNVSQDAGAVGTYEVNMSNKGNIPLNLSFASELDWLFFPSSVCIAPGKNSSLMVEVTVPPDAKSRNGSIIVKGDFFDVIPAVFNIRNSELWFEPDIANRSLESSNYSIDLIIVNGGNANASNVPVVLDCPSQWSCRIDKSSVNVSAGGNETVNLFIDFNYFGFTDKVTVTVREAKFLILLSATVGISELVGDDLVTARVVRPHPQKYYFVSNGTIVDRAEVDVTGLEPRVRRVGTVGTWTAKISPDSSLGLCRVFIYSGNVTHELLPNSTVSLAGEPGDYAYEYFMISSDTECRVKIDYGNVETETYLVAVSSVLIDKPVYTEAAAMAMVEAFKQEMEKERELATERDEAVLNTLGAIFVATAGFALWMVRRRSKPNVAYAGRAERMRPYVLKGNKVVIGRSGLAGEEATAVPKRVSGIGKRSLREDIGKFINKLIYRR